jgi:hypothetical protein
MLRPPVITWDEVAGRYRRANGQFVPVGQVRVELDRALANTERRVALLGDDFRAGRIGLNVWRTQFRAILKDTHLYSAALASGGWDRLDPAALGRVGAILRSEYGYLEAWVDQIRGGWLLDGRLKSRAGDYVQAARDTFENARGEHALMRGMDEEHNVIHPAEHCEGPDSCIEQSDRGWVPIGTLVRIGRRRCRRRCKCTMAYRQSSEVAA